MTPNQNLDALTIMRDNSNRELQRLMEERDKAIQSGADAGQLASLAARIAAARRSANEYAGRVTDAQTTPDAGRNKTYEEMLTGENRDAFIAIKKLFSSYGLESLAGKIFDYVKNGYSSDTISILLQDSDEYKKRFAANDARRKAGLNVLNPAEYISAENSYRQILRQSGLPKGFYDGNDDFVGFLTNDVSPTELQDRVNLATQASTLANSSMKEALQQMGIGQGEVAAYFLDPKKAVPFIQKAAAQAAIGAEAIQRGFQFDQAYAEQLATSGISREQAAQAYAKIGDEFSNLKSLGDIYGQGWTQREAEEDIFRGGNAASAKKRNIISNERGNFSGSAGTARGGLGQRGGQR